VLFMSATKTTVKCKCGMQEHDQDAIHCKNCGKKLIRKKVMGKKPS